MVLPEPLEPVSTSNIRPQWHPGLGWSDRITPPVYVGMSPRLDANIGPSLTVPDQDEVRLSEVTLGTAGNWPQRVRRQEAHGGATSAVARKRGPAR
ncbi:hypothetical protein GCM10009741_62320 [Kribbella lupini]|uniref:Uncharacterized protein n=1 Tax=Kribbella lupini TaxID=291602 RepID=A0ABP4MWX7_9ACTN